MAVSDVTADAPAEPRAHASFAALTVGSIGVVYGDIGTSPLYAFREALHALRMAGRSRATSCSACCR